MIYLDTNIFVYALGNIDKKTQSCINILNEIIQGKIEACTSVLTWDEFLHTIKKQMSLEEANLEGARFLRFPHIKFIDADYNVIVKAQDLAISYNLKPRDAIHAATAIINGAREIASDDSDFDKVKELKRMKI